MADAYEPCREDVQDKAAQELLGTQAHEFDFVAVGVVTPAELHPFAVEADEAVVGDCHAMCVASQILEHSSSAGKRRFCIHHPIVGFQPGEK